MREKLPALFRYYIHVLHKFALSGKNFLKLLYLLHPTIYFNFEASFRDLEILWPITHQARGKVRQITNFVSRTFWRCVSAYCSRRAHLPNQSLWRFNIGCVLPVWIRTIIDTAVLFAVSSLLFLWQFVCVHISSIIFCSELFLNHCQLFLGNSWNWTWLLLPYRLTWCLRPSYSAISNLAMRKLWLRGLLLL